MFLLPDPEPLDCWQLVGVDDGATPPTIARVLYAVGTRPEWRRAGGPVLFDDHGGVRPVQRGGREYHFLRVDERTAARLGRCRALG
jgi:hypothetical protein